MVYTRSGFEVTRGIIAFRDEDVVIHATFQRLIKGNGRTHELFFNFSQSLQSWLELNVVVT